MADEPGAPPTEQMVPISRMNAKIEENKALNAKLIEIGKEREKLAGLVLGYESRFEEAEKKLGDMGALQQQVRDM